MKCPNCQSEKFYLDLDAGLFFVAVDCHGNVLATDDQADLSLSLSSILHCVQCAWSGTSSELMPC